MSNCHEVIQEAYGETYQAYGGCGLPHTGLSIAVIVLAALVLLIVGLLLRKVAKERL